MKAIRVGIVGATGAVGVEMLGCLEQSALVVSELRLMASARSAGRKLVFQGREINVIEALPVAFADLDLVLFAAGAAVSRALAPAAVAAGARVIDNSSAFRGEPEVPLVVPEVNPWALATGARLVANPNCSTIIALVALGPLARAFGLRSLVASTYQAVSGAGAAGLEALAASLAGEVTAGGVFPAEISGNVIPFVGGGLEAGWTDEELKMGRESRKILGLPDLDVVCTCVRVPVRMAHTISLVAEFSQPVSVEQALRVLEAAPGLRLVCDGEAGRGLNPRAAEGQGNVLVGRLRQATGNRLALVAVGDQLLKGAALNALQIAEGLFLPA